MADDTNWDYRPDDDGEEPKAARRSVNWTASEYIDHKQKPGWFLALGVITLILAAAVYFLMKDYFATGIILVLGLIVGLFARRTPRELHYKLAADGLTIEEKFYPLSDFKAYSIIEEGIVCNLELTPLKRFMPPVSVYFSRDDEKRITGVLDNRLPYLQKDLDRIEQLSRRLRF